MDQLKIWTGVVCLLICTQVGCLHDPSFDQPYQPPKVKVKPQARAANPGLSHDTFDFIPNGKRDPFLSLGQRRVTNAPAARGKGPLVKALAKKPRTVLERYGIDEYRLRAVISGVARPFAMVVDPKGNSHIIRPGMRLGREGRVTRILSKGLVISTSRRTGTNLRRRTRRTLEFGPGSKSKRQQGYLRAGERLLKLDPRGRVIQKRRSSSR